MGGKKGFNYMALTHIQQSQITGSVSFSDASTLGSSMAGGDRSLQDDLNALRSLVKDIKGAGNWYDATTQDLEQIRTAVVVTGANAAFQGNVVLGLDGQGNDITFYGAAASDLDMANYKVKNLAQAATSGDALGWGQDASVSDLIVTAGDFLVASDGALDIAGSMFTVNADGNVLAQGKIDVSGDASFSSNVTLGGAGTDNIAFTGRASSNLDMNGSKVVGLAQAIAEGEALSWGRDASVTDLIVSAGDFTVNADGNVSANSLIVRADAQVDGNLLVKGAMTYIETVNLKVEDSFIHIATGSTGTSDKGIVFHSGGSQDDLILGQNGADASFIFAVHDADNDGVDTDNSIELAGVELAQAWLEGIQLGGVQGSLSGSFYADANGVQLSAPMGKAMGISGGSALSVASLGDVTVTPGSTSVVKLGGYNQDAISFMGDGERAGYISKLGDVTIVKALSDLYDSIASAGSGGNLAKVVVAGSSVTSQILEIAEAYRPGTADPKKLDVYLNGVLLQLGGTTQGAGDDVWFDGDNEALEFHSDYSLTAADKITLIKRA